MKVSELRIEGYRSLRNVRLPLDSMTTCIGPNGSGKSSALSALRLFFSPGRGVVEEDFWRAPDRSRADEISVAVTLSDLAEDEKEAFARYLSGQDELTIERVFSEPGQGNYLVTRHGVQEFAEIRQSPKGHRDRFNELVTSNRFQGLSLARNKEEAFAAMTEWEATHPDEWVQVTEDASLLVNASGDSSSIASHLQMVFVGALEDPESHLETRRGGTLDTLLAAVTDFSDIEDELLRISARSSEEIEKLLLGRNEVFESSKEVLNKSVEYFAPGFAVELEWGKPRPPQSNLPDVVTSVRGADGLETEMEYQGHGVQRSLMFGILSAQAELQSTDSSLRNIVAIEEPEAFQHPLSARALRRSLLKLAAGNFQIIYSTHSPELVPPSAVSGLRLFSRRPNPDDGGLETFVKAFSLEQMVQDFQAARGTTQDFTVESTTARIEANVDSSVLVGLFARLAVLVEGDEDAALLRGAAAALGLALDQVGVAVISCHGKTSIPLVLSFLREAGVATYPIFDLDRQKAPEKWKGSVWVEDAVRRLLGLDVDAELADTHVTESFSCWREDFAAVVRAEIGGRYEAHEQRVCRDLGYPVKQGRKVGPVIERVLAACHEDGYKSETLDALIQQIRTRVQSQ